MKYIFGILALLYIGGQISSCTKYEPIYGIVKPNNGPNLLNKNTVYIHDNDIYITNEKLTEHKQLTQSSSLKKTHCVIASTHDRIAYLDANGSPVILDEEGTQVAHLTQYTNVQDLNWYNGKQTLYILENNQLHFYGQALNLPNPLFSVFPTTTTAKTIDAIDIDSSLNVTYSYRYQIPYSQVSPLRKYYYGIAINYNSVTISDRKSEIYENYYDPATTSYSSLNYVYFYSAKFCSDSLNDFIITGSVNNNNQTNPNAYTLNQWNYTSGSISTGIYSTSLFNATGYIGSSKGSLEANEATLRKYIKPLSSQGSTQSVFIYNFDNSNNSYPLYFDWKP